MRCRDSSRPELRDLRCKLEVDPEAADGGWSQSFSKTLLLSHPGARIRVRGACLCPGPRSLFDPELRFCTGPKTTLEILTTPPSLLSPTAGEMKEKVLFDWMSMPLGPSLAELLTRSTAEPTLVRFLCSLVNVSFIVVHPLWCDHCRNKATKGSKAEDDCKRKGCVGKIRLQPRWEVKCVLDDGSGQARVRLTDDSVLGSYPASTLLGLPLYLKRDLEAIA